MIDKENEIYTRVYNALASELGEGNFNMSGIYVAEPAMFPHIFSDMTNNYPVYEDSSMKENYAHITITYNIYSNKSDGRKAECKKIANIIDNEMRRMNFTRVVYIHNDNPSEATVYTNDVHDENIFRLITRYEGVASEEHFYTV